MSIWKQSLSETDIWKINLYETSFIDGAIRSISGDVSDEEAIHFSLDTRITPPIGGTQESKEDYYPKWGPIYHGNFARTLTEGE